jgi:hypothetical protein
VTDDRRLDAQGKPIFNPEKAADTPARFVIHRGIKMISRYGFAHEYQTMMRAINSLHETSCRRISEIFCDSQACACYTVEGAPTREDLLALEQGFIDAAGGHNGITCGPIDIYPWWVGDDF